MATMMDKYKALPQKTKNYLQLGALVAALGGIYYRDALREMVYPADRRAVDSAKMKAREIAHDVSQAAK
ncbi:hypothetical protein BGW39_008213 [Mortierella sp. 14UC]|nr:hypothetical protein BGW39_008213 [Mortierella sp. 14UC]